jgi:acylphosphatase
MDTKSCMRCYVSGKVQGVWYRATSKEQAEKLGISGWAKNLPDGRVEIFACGESQQLDTLFQWLHQGPPLAKVEQCTREDLAWHHYEGFDVF